MFNVEDTMTIKKVIDIRDDILIPIYVKIGNNVYGLTELDDIEICSPSMLKIGFGSSNSIFKSCGFKKSELMRFSNVKLFNYFDEESQVATEYMMFESSDVEGDDPISILINYWFDIICKHIMDHVEVLRKERIKAAMEEE